MMDAQSSLLPAAGAFAAFFSGWLSERTRAAVGGEFVRAGVHVHDDLSLVHLKHPP